MTDFSTVDIPGTEVILSDDETVKKTLDFTFPWYDEGSQEIYLNSNGFVCFDPNCDDASIEDDSWQSQAVPAFDSPNNLLACFWNDLDPGEDGTVTFGTDGTKATITFEEVPLFDQPTTANTFQIVLFNDGSARCMLEDTDHSGVYDTAIGTENADGSIGVRFAHDDVERSEVGVAFDRISEAPTGVGAEPGPDRGEISVCWDSPADSGTETVHTYEVERATNDTASAEEWNLSSSEAADNATDLSASEAYCFVDSDLNDRAEHVYNVTAISDAGSGLTSDDVTATTWWVPTEPTHLSASEASGAIAIDLAWEAPNETGNSDIELYRILRDGATLTTIEPSKADQDGDGIYTFQDRTSLSCQTDYEYEVKAKNGGINEYGPLSAPATDSIDSGCPTAPQELETEAGVREANLTWRPPEDNGTTEDAVEYRIYRDTRTVDTTDDVHAVVQSSECSAERCWYDDDPQSDGTTYEYIVTAVNGDGLEGEPSDVSSATTYGAPEDVTADWRLGFDLQPQAVDVEWSPPSGDGLPIAGYEVYRADVLRVPLDGTFPSFSFSPDPGRGDFIAETVGTAYTDRPGALGYYCYSTAPKNEAGGVGAMYSPNLFDTAACTEVGDLSSYPAFVRPEKPQNVEASTLPSEARVEVCFEDPDHWGEVNEESIPEGSYRIYDGEEIVGEAADEESPSQCEEVEVTEPEPGVEHEMYVTAVSDLGMSLIRPFAEESEKAGPASVETVGAPTTPQNLVATTGTELGVIDVSWDAPHDPNRGGEPAGGIGIDHYEIEGKDASESSWNTIDGDRSTTLISDDDSGHGLPDDRTFEYRVRAVNDAGIASDWTEPKQSVSDNGQPDAPLTLDCSPGSSSGEIVCTVTMPNDDASKPRLNTGGSPLDLYRLYEKGEAADTFEQFDTAALSASNDAPDYVLTFTREDIVPGAEICFTADARNVAGYTGGQAATDGVTNCAKAAQ